VSDDGEFVDEFGQLRSKKALAGSFSYLLEVRKKQVTELRPGLTDDEFSAALGYVNTYLAYYSLDQILTLVDAMGEARSRLSYITDAEFAELRKMVQVSGDPPSLADELVRGVEALRPAPRPAGRPGRPKLTEEDRERRLRTAIDTLRKPGTEWPMIKEVAYELGMQPRSVSRWLQEYPDLARLFRDPIS
jgi:hypothetical protein